MYRISTHIRRSAAALGAAALMAATGCSNDEAVESNQTSSTNPANSDSTTDSTTATTATIVDAAGDVDWTTLPSTDVTLSDDGLAITDAGTYVLTGSSTGQVTVNAAGAVRIVLDGVNIESTAGAAIQVDQADLTVIELADDSDNSISDAATRRDEDIDAAIYSSDDLVLTGNGMLNVTANFADGIVGQGDLAITSGTYALTTVDDGIRGTDSLTIDGGTIDIVESVEGIEAPVIVIDDGDITINASDDGINASASDIITTGLSITINGGRITIVMASGDTDAIDSNGDLTITGGTIDITAQSAFDFDGTGTLTGGTITVNGESVTELTNQMMGGGGMGGGRPGGDPVGR